MEYYRIVLVVHILAFISWMAGILYLYRLLIYNSERGTEPQIKTLLAEMAVKLYKVITVPAMSVAWVAGLAMVAINPSVARGGWFHAKFTCVLLLTVSTIYAGQMAKRSSTEELPPGKRLRYLNEVPTILMVVIVILVILKPF